MIAYALREIRLRPRRLIATWIGIALSVAFFVATQVLATTEVNAMVKNENLETLSADIVVSERSNRSQDEPIEADQIQRAIARIPGALSAPLYTSQGVAGTGSEAKIVAMSVIPPSVGLRQGSIVEGRWPNTADEFVANRTDAVKLGLTVGDTTTFNDDSITLVGITDDPSTALGGYPRLRVSSALLADVPVSLSWIVDAPPGTGVADAVATINADLDAQGITAIRAMTGDEYIADRVANMSQQVDVLVTIANAFGVLSLVVGAIMISTTFAILLAQRRRQIALMRMVGASSAQIRRGLLIEATIVGAIGSVLGVALGFGVAAGVGVWSGSIGFGLEYEVLPLVLSFFAGILVTIVAAWVPVLRSSRIKPMEAIRESVVQQTRAFSVVRLVLTLLLAAVGAGLTVLTFHSGSAAFVVALGAGAVSAMAILVGAWLFVPPLLRLLGKLASRLGPVSRLAAVNSSRNAARSAATATALMLAVGLVVSLQVATATTKSAMIEQFAQQSPLDISVSSSGEGGFPASTIDRIEGIGDVGASAVVQGADVQLGDEGGIGTVTVLKYSPEVDAVLSTAPRPTARVATVGRGMLDDWNATEGDLTLVAPGGKTLTLHVVTTEYLMGEIMLDPGVFDELVADGYLANGSKAGPRAVWLSVPDRTKAASVYSELQQIIGQDGRYMVAGGLIFTVVITMVLDALLLIATILSAVAVVIALIGVGNTLGLSVLERTRESALLRALGLQRAGLRGSLMIEALLIGIVGVAVGVGAGLWFGWLASASLMVMIEADLPPLVVDPATTGVMVAIAFGAALLASVLPGRRAALATPVEALADID